MWVKGDLKDQLGIRHRNAKKNTKITASNLEAAPMFHEQHSRSLSELSTHNQYEPTMTVSPALGSTPRATYLDTPPMSEARDLLPPRESDTHYAYAGINPDHESHPSPNPSDNRQNSSVSPDPSYYSASQIPSPSPLPSPQYQYPSGEITTTPPSRRGSVVTTARSLVPTSPLPSPPRSPRTLQPPSGQAPGLARRMSAGGGSSNSPGTFELRVRSPTSHSASGHHGERSASSASYATAAEDYWAAGDEPGNDRVHATGQAPPGFSHGRTRSQQHHGVPLDVGDDDQETMVDGGQRGYAL